MGIFFIVSNCHSCVTSLRVDAKTASLIVIPAKRVFEWMQESKKVARPIDYRKPSSMVILSSLDSGIYSKTHKTGMTV